MIAQASSMYPLSSKQMHATLIIYVAQKIEPQSKIESQIECFGKAGMSMFGATLILPASKFSEEN